MKEFLGDPKERVPCLMDPHQPVMSGVVQNQDSYMKGKVAQRFFTDRVLGFVREAMKAYGAATGRRLTPVQSYRMEDAEVAILTIGSMAETLRATVDWATQSTDLRVGAVQLVCLRPFPAADLVRALSGVRAVAVIARLDDPLAGSSLLTGEVKAAFADALSGRLGMPRLSRMPRIHSGIAGLGSRDVRPGHFIATAKNLYERGKRDFVLGVEHELALPVQLDPDVRPPGAFSMRGYSVGGFGSVATNKIIATVTANLFDLHVQAYPFYGSEKKGLPTRYFLTAADQPIRTHCELHHVEFVPLSALASFNLGNPLEGITKGGTVFVQTARKDSDAVWWQVPPYARSLIRELDLRLFYADAAGIAAEVATREDLRVRMQGIVLLGVFLRAAPFVTERGMDRDTLMDAVRHSLTRYFGKAGERVVEENLVCVQRGYDEVREVPRSLIQEEDTEGRNAISGIRVAHLMTEGAVTCRPDTPLAEVHDLLSERQISCVVVVDDGGEMVGLLSTTDLARAQSLAARMDRSLPDLRAEHLMTPDVLTTRPEEPLAEAVERLVSNRVHRLVVTSEKEPTRPIGIFSLTDLAAAGPLIESR
jgi:pyruvate-ferredoxin/flavodoxin oxidoreductase